MILLMTFLCKRSSAISAPGVGRCGPPKKNPNRAGNPRGGSGAVTGKDGYLQGDTGDADRARFR